MKFITDVLVTVGEISLASLVIPYFTLSGLNISQFVIGLIAFTGSLILGLVVAKNVT